MDNQTKPIWRPDREREYRLFLIWKSIPISLRVAGREYAESLGIDDEDLLMLMGIKTQKDFAEKFGLNASHISEVWNKEKVPPEYEDINWRTWASKLTHNVVKRLYEAIMDEGDAARIKLWLQAVDNFVEESKVNENVSNETLKGVRDLISSIKSDGSKSGDNSSST